MKKTLAIMLVLMLVLVPVTAMAIVPSASVDGAISTFASSTNQAKTDFKVAVNTANINVTVPLSLVFVANANGGDLIAPAATIYQIKNNSTIALKVASISTSALEVLEGSANPPSLVSDSQEANGTGKNVFQMTLNGHTLGTSETPVSVSGTEWNIPAKTGTAGTCDITVAGTCSPLDFTTESTGVKLFSVTYTIAPGTSE